MIHDIASGSTCALEVLYQRYHRVLYTLAYRKIADHQITEDLLQEAFFTVWRRATSYSARSGAVRSWLYAIMQNRTIDYLRQAQRSSLLTIIALDEVDEDANFAYTHVWSETWRSILSAHISTALTRLVPEQRLVIELIYFCGWTSAQIATLHHIPLGTVKARARLALLHLKHILTQMGIDEL